MRHALAAASLLAILAACSSSDEDECPFVGTYSMTGEIETTTCKFPSGTPGPSASTIQVSAAEAGSGADFVYTVQGTTGRCPLSKVSACKLEGSCPLTVFDATTSNNQGSIQASWTFTKGGFSGISALTLPPFKDNPEGCVQTAKNTATRR